VKPSFIPLWFSSFRFNRLWYIQSLPKLAFPALNFFKLVLYWPSSASFEASDTHLNGTLTRSIMFVASGRYFRRTSCTLARFHSELRSPESTIPTKSNANHWVHQFVTFGSSYYPFCSISSRASWPRISLIRHLWRSNARGQGDILYVGNTANLMSWSQVESPHYDRHTTWYRALKPGIQNRLDSTALSEICALKNFEVSTRYLGTIHIYSLPNRVCHTHNSF
jgi:hypothetical protein